MPLQDESELAGTKNIQKQHAVTEGPDSSISDIPIDEQWS